MTRLTKAIRDGMVSALLTHKMKDEGERLKRENVALFKLVYDHVYTDELKKIVERLLVIMPGMVTKSDDFYVETGGMRFYVGDQYIGSSGARLQLPIADKIYVLWARSGATQIPPGSLHDRLQQFALDCKAYGDNLRQHEATASQALARFTTAKALAKGWPDAMPVIGHLIPEESAMTLPAVQVADLNRTFGLPPETVGV